MDTHILLDQRHHLLSAIAVLGRARRQQVYPPTKLCQLSSISSSPLKGQMVAC